MLTQEMVSILSCPSCHAANLRANIKKQKGELIYDAELFCSACESNYEVLNGIPNLIPANLLKNGNGQWQLWQNHLKGFEMRRQERHKEKKPLPHPSGKKLHQAFFEFAAIEEGRVLDVGCGPGKLRTYLNEERVVYYGLDPLPMSEVSGFRYVCALAEHIPFTDSYFSHIMVNAALDHFCDLDKFFQEAQRVLEPGGKVYVLQSIHEVKGPITAVKMAAHLIKDALDDRATKKNNPDTPKHMNEFSKNVLLEMLSKYFELSSLKEYSTKWYSPRKLFIAMQSTKNQG